VALSKEEQRKEVDSAEDGGKQQRNGRQGLGFGEKVFQKVKWQVIFFNL